MSLSSPSSSSSSSSPPSSAPFPFAPTSVWASALSFLGPSEWCTVESVSRGAHFFIASHAHTYWTPFLARFVVADLPTTSGVTSLAATNALVKRHSEVSVRRSYDMLSRLALLRNGWLGALDYDTFLAVLPALRAACECRPTLGFTGGGGHWTSWALPWRRGDIPHTDADGLALFHPTQTWSCLTREARLVPDGALAPPPVGIAVSVTTHDNENPRTVDDLILRFSVMEDAARTWRKDDGFLYVSLILLAGDRRTGEHAYVWAEFEYSVHELNDFEFVPELSSELRDTLERLGVFRLTSDGEIAQPPSGALLVCARHVG